MIKPTEKWTILNIGWFWFLPSIILFVCTLGQICLIRVRYKCWNCGSKIRKVRSSLLESPPVYQCHHCLSENILNDDNFRLPYKEISPFVRGRMKAVHGYTDEYIDEYQASLDKELVR